MISRGRIQKHEAGETSAFVAQAKKKKGEGGPSNSRRYVLASRESNRRMKRYKETLHFQCFNCHKRGHYALDCPEKNDASRSCHNNDSYNKKYTDRRRDASVDDEGHHSQKRSRNSRSDNNATATQSEYFVISTLFISSPPSSFGS